MPTVCIRKTASSFASVAFRAFCVLLVCGCGRGKPGISAQNGAEHTEAATRAPGTNLPAPEGLLGELFVPKPNQAWERLRRRTGATTMPGSLAVLIGTLSSLPPTALTELDLNIPVVGAVLDSPDGLAMEIAIHVKDGAHLVDLMTAPNASSTGTPAQTPAFTKSEASSSLVTLLAPSAVGAPNEAPIYAVVDNYLVLARYKEPLLRSAAYLVRTLPTRPMPTEDLVATAPQSALEGPLSAWARKRFEAWKTEREAEDLSMRQLHGGSMPDFGDPAEALADISHRAATFFAVLGDLAAARVGITLDEGHVRALFTAQPASKDGVAAQTFANIPAADAEPLLALPAGSPLALLTRDTPALRTESSKSQLEAIAKIFGGRLDAGGKARVESAFEHWSRGRGDWLTAGLMWNGNVQAAVLRGSVQNPGELGQGALGMLQLLGVPAFAEPLANWVGELKVSTPPPATALGDMQTARVVRKPAKVDPQRDRDAPRKNSTYDVVWSIDREFIYGAAGNGAKSAYLELRKDDRATLASDPCAVTEVRRLGKAVSFALWMDASAFLGANQHAPGSTPSTLLLAYGHGKSRAGDTEEPWFSFSFAPELVARYIVGSVH